MHKIEDNVPISSRRGAALRYPFDQLVAVGQSVLIPTDRPSAVQSAAKGYAYRHGCKFATSRVIGGVRVWRVA